MEARPLAKQKLNALAENLSRSSFIAKVVLLHISSIYAILNQRKHTSPAPLYPCMKSRWKIVLYTFYDKDQWDGFGEEMKTTLCSVRWLWITVQVVQLCMSPLATNS